MKINLNLYIKHPHQANRTEASRYAFIKANYRAGHVVRVEMRSLTLLLHILNHAYGEA